MDPTVMRDRVQTARVARLATVDASARPHLVPCTFALDGDTLYTAVDDVKDKSTRALRRLDNIRGNPHVSVLVDRYDDDWSQLWWVRLDGVARVVERGAPGHGEGAGLLVARYEQYSPTTVTGPMIIVAVTAWRAWP